MRILVKIGGRAAEEDRLISCLAGEMKQLSDSGGQLVLVHGGGITISRLQERFGVEPEFIDGLRQTSPEEMPLVDMALAGAVNKKLVRLFTRAGLKAWGLSGADGGLIEAESRSGNPVTNRTGAVTAVDTTALECVWNAGFVPICAPPGTDTDGRGMNINADEAALALAAALKTDALVFISDVPGVLDGGEVIGSLTPGDIEKGIGTGVIAGGMIPKTRSAAAALTDGVGAVIIGDYGAAGHLENLLQGERGTRIQRGSEGGYQHG